MHEALAWRKDGVEELANRSKDSRKSTLRTDYDLLGDAVGHSAENDCPRKTEDGAQDTDAPLGAVKSYDLESRTTNEDDHHLPTNHDTVNGDEKPIAMYAFKDVEFIVKSSIAAKISSCTMTRLGGNLLEFIEYLHPNKCIEDLDRTRVSLEIRHITTMQENLP